MLPKITANSSIRLTKPGYKRRSFSFQIKEPNYKWMVYPNEVIDDLNIKYKNGEVSLLDSLKIAENERAKIYQLRNELRPSSNPENLKILDRYVSWKYLSTHRRKRVMADTIRSGIDALNRSILALGDMCLKTTPIKDMQDRIDDLLDGNKGSHDVVVMRLNSLLRFIDRPTTDKLESLPETYDEPVRQISWEDLNIVLDGIDEHLFKVMIMISYFCGLRIGEIFALTKKQVSVNKNWLSIHVNRQMYRDLTYGLPKRRKIRRAFGFKNGKEWIDVWNGVHENKRFELRNKDYSKMMRKACKQAGVDEICFHDLRHCYAINLLNRGLAMTTVARSMGNSEKVCKKHYAGYEINEEGIEMMGQIISQFPGFETNNENIQSL